MLPTSLSPSSLKKPVSPGDHMVGRSERDYLADSSGTAPKLTVSTGPIATVVEAESAFIGGGRLRRQMVFYHDYPRIEFETELNDIPDRTVVVAEFPLASAVREVRRGVPYGFSHAAWAETNAALHGVARGITPAVRWSHYQMDACGVALLGPGPDRTRDQRQHADHLSAQRRREISRLSQRLAQRRRAACAPLRARRARRRFRRRRAFRRLPGNSRNRRSW